MNDQDKVHASEQIMGEVINVMVGATWVISGSILVAGALIGVAAFNVSAAMQSPIPWWVMAPSVIVPLAWGSRNIWFGAQEFVDIYSRRLVNTRHRF